MSIICRFAPSPTGLLHVGNARTALINWLLAKKNNGKFILRIDDTDLQRSKEEYVTQIIEDLNWLGLEYAEIFRQSDRMARYEEIKNFLIQKNRLYPCFESQEELEIKRKILLSKGKPPIYDRAALNLSQAEIENLIKEGKRPHYRFKLDDGKIFWNDQIRGNIHFEGKNLSDPILIREDGSMTYMLCSVIDDMDYNITHVVRGEDHITNTAISIQIIEALQAQIPNFAHLSLLKSQDAEISKRDGGFDIKSLRDEYIEPMTINSLLATIGSSQPIEIYSNLSELVEHFDIKYFGKAPAIYDKEELIRLNHKLISKTPFSLIAKRITEIGIDINEAFWESVKGNINLISDLEEWAKIYNDDFTYDIPTKDVDFLSEIIQYLPKNNWNQNTWNEWIAEIKKHSSRKGSELFLPIRMALTGKDNGPELGKILVILGPDKVKKRLAGK